MADKLKQLSNSSFFQPINPNEYRVQLSLSVPISPISPSPMSKENKREEEQICDNLKMKAS